jgi:hypothetical protein
LYFSIDLIVTLLLFFRNSFSFSPYLTLFLLVVLGIDFRALSMLGKCSNASYIPHSAGGLLYNIPNTFFKKSGLDTRGGGACFNPSTQEAEIGRH